MSLRLVAGCAVVGISVAVLLLVTDRSTSESPTRTNREESLGSGVRGDTAGRIPSVGFERESEERPDGSESLDCVVLVRGFQGRPLPEARVVCAVQGGRTHDAQTDEEGIAAFEIDGPCGAMLRVEADGYYALDSLEIEIASGDPVRAIDLIRLTTLEVHVSAYGAPVADATVKVSPLDFYSASVMPLRVGDHARTGVTNEHGVARFADLGLGTYNVTAYSPKYIASPLMSHVKFETPGESRRTTVNFVEGVVTTIEVVDGTTGYPVPGAMVDLEQIPFSPVTVLPSRETDENGRLVVVRPPRSTCYAKVLRHEGFMPAGAKALPGQNSLRVELERTPKKYVVVREEITGKVVRQADIEIKRPEGNLERRSVEAVGGRFEMEGLLVSQSHRFRFLKDGATTIWRALRPEEFEIELALAGSAIVTGRLASIDGVGIEGLRLSAWHIETLGGGIDRRSSYVAAETTTGAGGAFRIALPGHNLHRVRIHSGQMSCEDLIVEVGGSGDHVWRYGANHPAIKRAIVGRTTDVGQLTLTSPGSAEVFVTLSGKPLAYSQVWLVPKDGVFPRSKRLLAIADINGRVVFPKVHSGEYSCVASVPSMLRLPPMGFLGPGLNEPLTVRPGENTVLHYDR